MHKLERLNEITNTKNILSNIQENIDNDRE